MKPIWCVQKQIGNAWITTFQSKSKKKAFDLALAAMIDLYEEIRVLKLTPEVVFRS